MDRRRVVDPEHARAALVGEHVGRDRRGDPILDVGRPVILPRNDLREVPTSTGRPRATISSSRRSSSRLCATVLPNPMPGSSRIRSSATPRATANAIRSSRNALTSETTSSYRGSGCIVRGSPSMCIKQQSAPLPATTEAIAGSARSAVTSLTIVAPASSAAAATCALEVSIEISACVPASRSPSITGSTRAQLLLGRHRLGARPRRLAADVEQHRAGALELARVLDRCARVEVQPAVGERVRGHVDDPHHLEVVGQRAPRCDQGSSSGQWPVRRRSARVLAPPPRARGCSARSAGTSS